MHTDVPPAHFLRDKTQLRTSFVNIVLLDGADDGADDGANGGLFDVNDASEEDKDEE